MVNSRPTEHALTREQVDAVQIVMQLLLEDDLGRNELQAWRQYCDACERVQPSPGFIQYDRYAICHACSTEYELARLAGFVDSPGQYVRAKRFGDLDKYMLAEVRTS